MIPLAPYIGEIGDVISFLILVGGHHIARSLSTHGWIKLCKTIERSTLLMASLVLGGIFTF